MHAILRGDSMRGLAVFISDIRNCKSKEAENKRINKELANVRSKFKGEKSLDGYSKKKYVCKLLFIFLLGHDIDFGHMEAVNLTTSNRYTEKHIGYLFISILVSSNSNLIKLIIQNMRNDIKSNKAVYVNLALHCMANFSSTEIVEAFHVEIPKLLLSGQTTDTIKQSAALCFLQLFRTAPEKIPHSELAPRLIHLLNDHDMGVLTASVSLLQALAQYNPALYQSCLPFAVSRLDKIITSLYSDLQDYTYYYVPAPWLTIKLLKLLQCFPLPSDTLTKVRLIETLGLVISRSQEPVKSKRFQHSNARNAILFEAINLVIHIESESDLLVRACNQLGLFLLHRETNLRYLALETLTHLAGSEASCDVLSSHQFTIINALKTERDVSVRQRAIDLLYAMCDHNNVEHIVGEMLSHLEKTDYSIREEMALKIAILSEKFANRCTWYVDTILDLIQVAGDYIADEVWHRLIHIVVNREDTRKYATEAVFKHLQSYGCHESIIKVGGFLLGEFGGLIADRKESSPIRQFEVLRSKHHICSSSTQSLLLSTYIKFAHLFLETRELIQDVFQNENLLRNPDIEIQQRACEYAQLSRNSSAKTMDVVLKAMPSFPERSSSLIAKLQLMNPAASQIKLKEEERSKRRTNSEQYSSHAGFIQAEQSFSAELGSCATSKDSSLLVDFGPVSTSQEPIVDPQAQGFLDSSFTEISGSSSESSPIYEAEYLSQFLIKNNGVLFEDDLLQIGVKSEFKEQFGRLSLFFGNKTSEPFEKFSASLQHTFNSLEKISISTLKEAPVLICAGSQVQYIVNLECLKVFKDPIVLIVQYDHKNSTRSFSLKVPVLINKFMVGVDMSAADFRARWQQLGLVAPETKIVFEAKEFVDIELAKTKLTGFGWTCLSEVDPNPRNLVGCGILKTNRARIGCLLRLEPNTSLMMYRLTVRTSNQLLSPILSKLLIELL